LRYAAVAAVLLVIGSAFVLDSFRNRPDAQIAGGKQVVSAPVVPESQAALIPVKSNDANIVKAPPQIDQPRGVAPIHRSRGNSGVRNEFAGLRGNRLGTRDQASTSAGVLKRGEQLAEAYPTAAFPINASNQSLKVSVDNANGASRTISLPTVSFGSQRSLSSNGSPLMAQARGTW
jgi:hypothetical protein